MPKKNWTPEERKAFGEKMKAAKTAKQKVTGPPELPPETAEEFDKTDFQEDSPSMDELLREMREIKETNALLKAAVLNNNVGAGGQPSNSVGVRGTTLVGEVDKYLVDPANYPDPTKRLAKEARLQPLAFDYNYELDYQMDIVSYETKTGLNMREPKFLITLNRVVLDDQGNQTNKRYIARRLVFHEDPQAALVIARENGLPVDPTNEKQFLDEMRYLRVRNWLFDYFWPIAAKVNTGIQEEVIGGSIVQVFTKNSEEASGIDFDKIDSKLRT